MGELTFKIIAAKRRGNWKMRAARPKRGAACVVEQVASAVEIYDKAHELISEADQLKPPDKPIVLQKAAVMAKAGVKRRVDYLQHMHVNEIRRMRT